MSLLTLLLLLLLLFLLLLLLLPQGLSITGAAMATMEMARVDASCATYYLVHTFLAMLTVSLMVGVREAAESETAAKSETAESEIVESEIVESETAETQAAENGIAR